MYEHVIFASISMSAPHRLEMGVEGGEEVRGRPALPYLRSMYNQVSIKDTVAPSESAYECATDAVALCLLPFSPT